MTHIAELTRPQRHLGFVAVGSAPQRRERAPSRLADYRYGTRERLLKLMTERFSVVRRVVGNDSFFERAQQYIALHPPRLPVLASYGENFPQFIRTLSNEACFAYVADIAEIEMACVRAAFSADAPALPCNAFKNFSTEELLKLSVTLHPSVSFITSRFAVVAAWQANQPGQSAPLGVWGRQGALIARRDRKAEVWLLPPGGFAFLCTLGNGSAVGDAALKAQRADKDFDLGENLSLLANARAVIGLA